MSQQECSKEHMFHLPNQAETKNVAGSDAFPMCQPAKALDTKTGCLTGIVVKLWPFTNVARVQSAA